MIKKTHLILTGVTLMSSITLFGSHPMSVYAEEMNMSQRHISQYKKEKKEVVKDTVSELRGTLKETEKKVLNRDDIKKLKKVKLRKAEIKKASEADYQIKKDGSEENQFQEALKTIVSHIQKKDIAAEKSEDEKKMNIASVQTPSPKTMDMTKQIESTKDSSTMKKIPLENELESKTRELPKEEKDSISENQQNTAIYVYDNYLIETTGFDKTQNGLQNVEVNVRTLSMVEKQLLDLTDNPELFHTIKNNIMTQADSEQKYNKTITVGMMDTTGPEINLTDKSQELIVGDAFDANDYIKNVSDTEDGDLEYTVEGEVDINTPGTYNLTVSAKDLSGNTTDTTLNIVVKKDLQKTFYNKIAEAAKAQIGRTQDCTMLVTNSLASVGINFHGWPIEYAQLGEWTNNPVPGDIIIYQGHVAIYIGNGRAIHGGFRGNQTVEWTANCTNALIGYIHVTPPASYR